MEHWLKNNHNNKVYYYNYNIFLISNSGMFSQNKKTIHSHLQTALFLYIFCFIKKVFLSIGKVWRTVLTVLGEHSLIKANSRFRKNQTLV